MGEFRGFFGDPELDEGLVGDIELARVVADGVEDIFRHAQGDGFCRRAQLGEGRKFGFGPVDVFRAVVLGRLPEGALLGFGREMVRRCGRGFALGDGSGFSHGFN